MDISNSKVMFIKEGLGRLIWFYQKFVRRLIYSGGKQYCPVCDNYISRFLPFGTPVRANALCPVCYSLERHRLDWLFFRNNTNLFDEVSKTMLHIAPESFIAAHLRKIENLSYLSADLFDPKCMVQMDITDINYENNSFSIIYCSHVLEHIQDDHKAIAELYRVLNQNGWAVLQVPITVEKTYENSEITNPEERKKHFGQSDHVRRCGPDYIERLKNAGFVVELLYATDVVTKSDCLRMGIQPERLIFFCRK